MGETYKFMVIPIIHALKCAMFDQSVINYILLSHFEGMAQSLTRLASWPAAGSPPLHFLFQEKQPYQATSLAAVSPLSLSTEEVARSSTHSTLIQSPKANQRGHRTGGGDYPERGSLKRMSRSPVVRIL